MAARLSKTSFTSLVFKPCSVAMSFTMAPFVNLLLLVAFMARGAFIAFFIGAMVMILQVKKIDKQRLELW